jgi:hypothetical protein
MNDTTQLPPAEHLTDTIEYIILYDGYTVAAAFFDAVRYQVEEIIPALDPNGIYTLEVLCGDVFWQRLTAGEQRLAGRCMASMVVNKQLPFRFVQGEHEYPKLYQLINDDDS